MGFDREKEITETSVGFFSNRLRKVCFHELNPVQVRVKITAEVRDAAAFGAGPAGSPEEEVVDQQEKMVVHIAAHRREDIAVSTVLARRNALKTLEESQTGS